MSEPSDAPVTLIAAIAARAGQRVTVQGWLFNSRGSKTVRFLQLRDGSGRIQGVVGKDSVPAECWDLAGTLDQEASVRVTGKVKADSRAPSGYELEVDGVQLINRAPDYPITNKEHGPDFLLDRRHLWLRSKRQWAIMRVRSKLFKFLSDFFDGEGFVRMDAPIFTPNACEGTTTLFETEYFGSKAYLSQSGQLYMEAGAMSHGKVYCLGPTFRAEKSKTRRHLTEFWMIEPEVAFNDWKQNIELQERMTVYLVGRLLEACKEELAICERDVKPLEAVKAPFPRLSYDEAIAKLKELGVQKEWGGDFGAEDETKLSEAYDRPIFCHHYPSQVKAWYMKWDPARPETCLNNDMLAPEGYGEVIGGGQREDDIEALLARIRHDKLPEEAFQWYLDLRRYGSVPHSGFGMGIERFVTWFLKLPHLREAAAFPRMIYRNTP